MVVIKSATFGDEYSNTNVLKTLQDKLSSSGGIDVTVDSSLIPFVSTSDTVSLAGPEKEDIKNQAAQICGPNDQTCLEIKSQELARQKLKEKETETVNAASIVKGRRLTVNYTDETGDHTVVVPEGQTFALGAAAKPDPGFDYEAAASPWKKMVSSVWGIIGTALTTFLYATSIIITWMTFSEFGNRVLTIGMTAVSVFIPLSGFGLSFLGAALPSYFGGDRILRARISAQKR